MRSRLRILHLEDDRNDADLIRSNLEDAGVDCAITSVQNQCDFAASLQKGHIDLILSDCALPGFDGMLALRAAQSQYPKVPFIFVSGTMGEQRAIDSLKSGATDYVLKENLSRLAPSVRRAMQEVAARAECQRLEKQFIEAQKMEVVGQLAGGVAHDFNNILAVIMGHSDFIRGKLSSDHELQSDVEAIRLAGERAITLTRQLLVFSRKQTVQPIALDLNAVINDVDKMLRRLLDENIEMTIAPGKEVGFIKADPGYILQVLMNLAVNARDAMPNGGRLTIATDNVTVNEARTSARPNSASGDFVMLSVSDTGCGMTDEVKARLFEAFFTTKPKGKGTGLGLATCQTIVQQSGGHIGVHSEVGKGTVFKIYFPRIEQQPAVVTTAVEDAPLPRGTETLLLVEDEPSVRQLACSILESHGYNVLRANNGHEGLRVARECKNKPIRLVITDVIMPQMSGKVMAEWLTKTYPGLKVLFTSGYTDDAIAHYGVLEPGVELLPKPYTSSSLVRKVRALLDAN